MSNDEKRTYTLDEIRDPEFFNAHREDIWAAVKEGRLSTTPPQEEDK